MDSFVIKAIGQIIKNYLNSNGLIIEQNVVN